VNAYSRLTIAALKIHLSAYFYWSIMIHGKLLEEISGIEQMAAHSLEQVGTGIGIFTISLATPQPS
jgi:hypothetical protein